MSGGRRDSPRPKTQPWGEAAEPAENEQGQRLGCGSAKRRLRSFFFISDLQRNVTFRVALKKWVPLAETQRTLLESGWCHPLDTPGRSRVLLALHHSSCPPFQRFLTPLSAHAVPRRPAPVSRGATSSRGGEKVWWDETPRGRKVMAAYFHMLCHSPGLQPTLESSNSQLVSSSISCSSKCFYHDC